MGTSSRGVCIYIYRERERERERDEYVALILYPGALGALGLASPILTTVSRFRKHAE